MKVEKSSLVAMLLEVGEENTAVLLARSQLPDEIDTDHDLDTLATFGLERDQIAEVVNELSARERDHGLSAGEQRMLERARRLLAHPDSS